MESQLTELQTNASAAINAAPSTDALKEVEVDFLGRKGQLTGILRGLKDLAPEEKGKAGKLANEVKEALLAAIEAKEKELKEARYAQLGETEWMDPTAPGTKTPRGTLHPITQSFRRAEKIFTSMGFTIADGPQVEDSWHNFDALNIPADHPARDTQDTLFVRDTEKVLRTHTSSIQIRFAEENEPPFRIIAPGKVARKDDFDASHSPVFHQLEGMMVDRDISLAHMKAVMEEVVQQIMERDDLKFRWRTSYFPFVEPGLEVDMSCTICDSAGCAACQQTGWVEIVGCGMIHPNVLKNCNIDPEKFSGFAFGFGWDRLVMMRHKVKDIRLLYENDTRFLKQF